MKLDVNLRVAFAQAKYDKFVAVAARANLGILLIELGVGMTVASVIIIIFFNFAGRKGPHQITDDLGA